MGEYLYVGDEYAREFHSLLGGSRFRLLQFLAGGATPCLGFSRTAGPVCLLRVRSPCPDRPPTWRPLVGPRERGYKRPLSGGPGVWFGGLRVVGGFGCVTRYQTSPMVSRPRVATEVSASPGANLNARCDRPGWTRSPRSSPSHQYASGRGRESVLARRHVGDHISPRNKRLSTLRRHTRTVRGEINPEQRPGRRRCNQNQAVARAR
jgi:hypothetical protein